METGNYHHNCGLCQSRRHGIFCNLTERDLAETDLTRSMAVHEPGELLFREGRPATTIHCIHSGLVKLTHLTGDGDQVAVRLHGPGEVIGYRDVLADSPYSTTAETIRRSRICAVPRKTFEGLVHRTPPLALELLGSLAKELRHQERRQVVGGAESVRKRAARLLLQLWEAEEPNGDVRAITTPIMRNEMSQIISTTPETFSRTLRALADSGVVEFGRRHLTVRDIKALRQIIAGNERSD